MEPFPDITGLDIFPGIESNTMEFKLSLSNIIKNRCISTICSFLNSKGGYIVFGVENKERRIIGINLSLAELDEHLLWFDNLYHSKRITDSNGNKLKPGTIETRIINVKPEIYILVLVIKPNPDETYKCQDGTSWHRLSASDYCFQEGSSDKEMIIMQEKLNLEKTRLKYALTDIELMRKDMHRIISLAKDIDEQMNNFTKAVTNDIIMRKKIEEKKQNIEKNLCSYLTYIFGRVNI
jgi:predicted HTH transcriptional regulator